MMQSAKTSVFDDVSYRNIPNENKKQADSVMPNPPLGVYGFASSVIIRFLDFVIRHCTNYHSTITTEPSSNHHFQTPLAANAAPRAHTRIPSVLPAV